MQKVLRSPWNLVSSLDAFYLSLALSVAVGYAEHAIGTLMLGGVIFNFFPSRILAPVHYGALMGYEGMRRRFRYSPPRIRSTKVSSQ